MRALELEGYDVLLYSYRPGTSSPSTSMRGPSATRSSRACCASPSAGQTFRSWRRRSHLSAREHPAHGGGVGSETVVSLDGTLWWRRRTKWRSNAVRPGSPDSPLRRGPAQPARGLGEGAGPRRASGAPARESGPRTRSSAIRRIRRRTPTCAFASSPPIRIRRSSATTRTAGRRSSTTTRVSPSSRSKTDRSRPRQHGPAAPRLPESVWANAVGTHYRVRPILGRGLAARSTPSTSRSTPARSIAISRRGRLERRRRAGAQGAPYRP